MSPGTMSKNAEEDIISFWTDKKGEMKVLTYNEMINQPVQVIRKENNIFIRAKVNFTGEALGTLIYEESTELYRKRNNNYNKMLFEDLVIKGFEKWTGEYNLESQKVSVKVLVERTKKNAINIELKKYGDRNGVRYKPLGWSVEYIPTKMVLYAHYSETLSRDWKQVMNDAAHEFGHVLGLGDAYGKDDGSFLQTRIIGLILPEYRDLNRKDAPSEVPENDIMRAQTTVTDYDINLMWRAWRDNEYQAFPEIS